MDRTMKMCTLMLMAVSILSCVPQATTVKKVDGPRIIALNGEIISEQEHGPFVTWICKDYYMREERILVEVGFSSNPKFSRLGFILFDGGDSGESTIYTRQGLDHRWDWGPNNEYAFIINASGLGMYYDFTLEKQSKPKNLFKCYRR